MRTFELSSPLRTVWYPNSSKGGKEKNFKETNWNGHPKGAQIPLKL